MRRRRAEQAKGEPLHQSFEEMLGTVGENSNKSKLNSFQQN